MLKASHTYKQLSDQRKKTSNELLSAGAKNAKKILKAIWIRNYLCLRNKMFGCSVWLALSTSSSSWDPVKLTLFLQICPQETARQISLRVEPACTLPWQWVSNFWIKLELQSQVFPSTAPLHTMLTCSFSHSQS